MKLAKYALMLVAMKKDWCKHLKYGLRNEIPTQLITLTAQCSYVKLVETVLLLRRLWKEKGQWHPHIVKKREGRVCKWKRIASELSQVLAKNPVGVATIICRMHVGTCKQRTITCFKCGKIGRHQRKCKEKSKLGMEQTKIEVASHSAQQPTQSRPVLDKGKRMVEIESWGWNS